MGAVEFIYTYKEQLDLIILGKTFNIVELILFVIYICKTSRMLTKFIEHVYPKEKLELVNYLLGWQLVPALFGVSCKFVDSIHSKYLFF